MGLEAATYIHELDPANPVGAADPKSQGDDHLRMIKAALQATFSGITGEVTVTHTQINTVVASGITGFAAPANDVGSASQSEGVATTAMRSDATLQVNLTAIYIWTGRHTFEGGATVSGSGDEVLRLARTAPYVAWYNDAESVRYSYIQANPAASTLIIANEQTNGNLALTTNGTGVVTHNGNIVPHVASSPTWTGSHVFTSARVTTALVVRGVAASPNITAYMSLQDSAGGEAGYIGYGTGTTTFSIVNNTSNGNIDVATSGTGLFRYGGIEVGYRDVPRVTGGFERGKCYATAAGVTLNTTDMAEGRCFSVYNNSAVAITLTQGAGVTLRLGGTATTGNRTIAARGMCTIWCNSATEAIATGHVS